MSDIGMGATICGTSICVLLTDTVNGRLWSLSIVFQSNINRNNNHVMMLPLSIGTATSEGLSMLQTNTVVLYIIRSHIYITGELGDIFILYYYIFLLLAFVVLH